MRYLTLVELLDLYGRVTAQSGGAAGLRDRGAVESALAQPSMAFDGEELHPTPTGQAAALGFSLIQNHPFIDGNKRVGHVAMETFLVLNGWEIASSVDEQEGVILQVAGSVLGREALAEWLGSHVARRPALS